MLLNRKLIIAVLTIGLMLSFSSAAIGYDDTNKQLSPVPKFNPNATHAGQASPVIMQQPILIIPYP